MGRRRNPWRTRGRGRWNSVLPEHDVDLLARTGARGRREAVLVSALCHARPRLHALADRTRESRELFGIDADPRPADPGTAPSRNQERPDRATETHVRQFLRHREQAGMALARLARAE